MFFIYGADNSSACDKAEFLLYSTGLEYRIYVYGRDYTLKQLQRLIPGADTVPHIYHGAKYIGGVKELFHYLQSNEVIRDYKREYEGSERVFTKSSSNGQSESDVHKD